MLHRTPHASKTRRFAPKQTEALPPRAPASQYLTKNRGRPAESKPAPGPAPRMKHQRQARAVARRSIQNKLPMAYFDQDESNPADSWLDLDDVAVVLGESEADTYARHLNGSPPHFQERYIAADREFRLQCSLESLTLFLIDEATR